MSCRVMSSRVKSSKGAGRNGSNRRAELVSDRVGSGRVSCRLSRRAELGWVKSGWDGSSRVGRVDYSIRFDMKWQDVVWLVGVEGRCKRGRWRTEKDRVGDSAG